MAAEYSAASVERALDIHVKGHWRRHQLASGKPTYLIETNGIGTVEFTLAQAYAFVCGYAECDRAHRNASENKRATQAVIDRVNTKGGAL